MQLIECLLLILGMKLLKSQVDIKIPGSGSLFLPVS